MNLTQASLKQFFFDVIRPYKWYIAAFFFIALYWGINNSLSPYVLKIITDKAAAVNGDKFAVFNAFKPYVVLYMVLWFFIAVDMRFLDRVKLKLFVCLNN